MKTIFMLLVCVMLCGCKHTQVRKENSVVVKQEAKATPEHTRNVTIQILPIQTVNIGLL